MVPVILTFRYSLPNIEAFSTEQKPGQPLGVIRSAEASKRTRVLMCDATPILEAFPELLDIQDEDQRVQKLMESFGLLFHMARQVQAGKPLSNPLALAPKGTRLVDETGETKAIWADIPPPPREMDTKSVNLFLFNIVAMGLHKLAIPHSSFPAVHEGWLPLFKDGASEGVLAKDISKTDGLLEDVNEACLQLARGDVYPTPSTVPKMK